jgi:hypothetical protein
VHSWLAFGWAALLGHLLHIEKQLLIKHNPPLQSTKLLNCMMHAQDGRTVCPHLEHLTVQPPHSQPGSYGSAGPHNRSKLV